jgi:hypothetical protein
MTNAERQSRFRARRKMERYAFGSAQQVRNVTIQALTERKFFEQLEREAHERRLNRAYHKCAHFASQDLREHDPDSWPASVRQHFPFDRPHWWLPPPGMIEEMEALKSKNGGCVPCSFDARVRELMGRYDPDRGWPWVKLEI